MQKRQKHQIYGAVIVKKTARAVFYKMKMIYFLKLSLSATARLNTRCSGVESLLSTQK